MSYRIRIVGFVVGLAVCLTLVLSLLELGVSGEAIEPGELLTDFVEMLVIALAIVIGVFGLERLRTLEGEAEVLKAKLDDAARAGADWRRQSAHFARGLSAAVAQKFDDWGLTEAEADIAGMILKGASLKEIAQVRQTSQATIRQQAQAIYRKSGLANRSELAAYFLQDVFDMAAARSAAEHEQSPKH